MLMLMLVLVRLWVIRDTRNSRSAAIKASKANVREFRTPLQVMACMTRHAVGLRVHGHL